MIFNSFQFIWLFPVIFIVYWAVSYFKWERFGKAPQYTLLAISYGLYMQWNPAYGLILFYVSVITFLFARILYRYRSREAVSDHNEPAEEEKTEIKKGRRLGICAAGVFLALGPLLIFKYYNFITDAGASVLANIGIDIAPPGLNWVVPLGLSFYTFQALGYLWDVYYQKITPEKSFGNYMLFVAFFPQILCGPISKPGDLLPQIATPRPFEYTRAVKGLQLILWGMFLKLVLADRIGIYVDTVYNNYKFYSGSTCLLSSILYSFQIYGDFAGYSYMAIGVARLLGFELVYNFKRPYFATSVSQFWKRWNISLTTWLTTYIYIPLGGSRKGKFRTYLNILVTFLVSGIWHGANYTFILWGAIHGAAQCLEKSLGLNKPAARKWWILPRILLTFSIVALAWIFFRMPTISDATKVIAKIFTSTGQLFVDAPTLTYLAIAFIILLPTELLLEYKNQGFKAFLCRHSILRWSTYVFLTLIIALFGVLDSSQFIYVSF